MKILQVIPYFHPRRGGDVNVCYNLSKQLAKKGYEVTILTTDFEIDKEYIESIKKEGVDIIALNYTANIGLFLRSPDIKKWAQKNLKKYDIIHMHTYRAYQNNIISRYARKYNIPYIIQAHGSLLTFFTKPKLKKLYDFVWGYKILKDASKVIALTDTEAEQYKKMGVDENKIEIVPNGINLDEYKKLPEKGIFRKKYSIRENEKLILYVGRIHKSKGIDILIESFANLLLNLPDSKLVLLGPDDGYMEEMKNIVNKLKIGKNVIFTGFVNSKIKMAAYTDADVFVTPNFTGFPITFLEAMFFGPPIITTDKGDKLDWIHNKVGYVVEYGKEQLGNAIYTLLNDDKLRKRFGDEEKRMIREKFNWDKIVKRVENIYCECTS